MNNPGEGLERRFKQSVDLTINLKGLPNGFLLDEFVELPNERKPLAKVYVFKDDTFLQYGDKRKGRKFVREYDFFIGLENKMPMVAKTLGKYLIKKMPSKKAGHILSKGASNNEVDKLVRQLQHSVRVRCSDGIISCKIGDETMSEEKLRENILAVYDKVKSLLPEGKHNIRSIYTKKTMGIPTKLQVW